MRKTLPCLLFSVVFSFFYFSTQRTLHAENSILSNSSENGTEKTITMPEAGKLAVLLPKEERADLKKIKIVGPMQENDFWVLRSCPLLESIDLSLVSIIDGGKGIPDCLPKECFKGKQSIKNVILPNKLKAIGAYAFQQSGITSMYFPETIDSIASGAFQHCKGIVDIKLPESVQYLAPLVFCGCTNLKSIQLSSQIKKLGDFVFSGCTTLNKVSLPEKIEEIGYKAFENTPINEIKLTKTVKKIGEKAFFNCHLKKVISEAVTPPEIFLSSFMEETYTNATLFIKKEAMGKYKDLATWGQFKNIREWTEQPDNISPDGYSEIKDLKAGTLSQRVKNVLIEKIRIFGELKKEDFDFIRTLKQLQALDLSHSVVIDDGYGTANRIPDGGLKEMVQLQQIKTPSQLTAIGKNAFENTGILSITLPKEIVTMGAASFKGAKDLKAVTIISNEMNIPDMAFSGCTTLTDVVLPTQATSIGDYAFADCSSLRLIGLPETLSLIGEFAFSNTALKELAMGTEIKIIQANAFENVPLTKITCLANNPPILVESAFSPQVYETATLTIHRGAKEKYKNNTIWRKFKNIQLDNAPIVDPDGFLVVICDQPGTLHETPYAGTIRSAKKIRIKGTLNKKDFDFLRKLPFTENMDLKDVIIDAYPGQEKEYPAHHIPKQAFLSNKKIKNIILPTSIIGIDDLAFGECDLTEIHIPANVKEIGFQVFFMNQKMTKAIIDATITETGRSMFSQCTGLVEVKLPKNLRSLNNTTFYNCSSLISLELPSSLEKICANALEGTAIQELTIPENVKKIEEEILTASAIKKITCKGPVPQTDTKTFDQEQYRSVVVNIHETHKEGYSKHPVWKNFFHLIVLETGENVDAQKISSPSQTIQVVSKGIIRILSPVNVLQIYNAKGELILKVRNLSVSEEISIPVSEELLLLVADKEVIKIKY